MDTASKVRAFGDLVAFKPTDLLNPKQLIEFFGLFGVWAIMFAETGLLVGFFFPGDSLLFLAGVASSPVAADFDVRPISLPLLLIGAPICAITGAQVGHLLGAKYGRKMFDRPDSRLFKREYVEKAEYYFEKFGPAKAVVLARFIPIVRTFLNPVAGVLEMPARQFFIWNVVGGLLWTDGILLAGYGLAKQIRGLIPPEKIDTYLLPAVVLIVIISALPIFIEIIRDRRNKRRGIVPGRPTAAVRATGTASVPGPTAVPAPTSAPAPTAFPAAPGAGAPGAGAPGAAGVPGPARATGTASVPGTVGLHDATQHWPAGTHRAAGPEDHATWR